MTLVTLHGFLGSPSLWQRVFEQPALAPLAGQVEHRWLPGHGPDPWKPAGSFDAIVDELAARLPPGAVVLGYSQGARLAAGLLARHPGRVASVVMVGGQAGLPGEAERAERRAWDDDQAAQIERDGLDAFAARWEQLPLFATQRALPPALLAWQRAQRTAHRPDAVAWSMRALGLGRMPSYADALAPHGDRVALVYGSLDLKFEALAASLALRCPGARCIAVEGAGHNVPLERPGALALALAHLLSPSAPASSR